jgi:acetyl-CoA carboxylase biotin carboxyl carrier protein
MAFVDIRSEIAGKVWKVEKRPGDAVAEDEPVLILESMKMEIPVLSPRYGRIAELRVDEGESVREGQVLARLET